MTWTKNYLPTFTPTYLSTCHREHLLGVNLETISVPLLQERLPTANSGWWWEPSLLSIQNKQCLLLNFVCSHLYRAGWREWTIMNDWNWVSALSDIYHSINLKDLWTQRLSFSSPFEGTNLYGVYGASLSHLMLLTQLVHFMLRLQINRPLQLKGCNSTRLSRLRCTCT